MCILGNIRRPKSSRWRRFEVGGEGGVKPVCGGCWSLLASAGPTGLQPPLSLGLGGWWGGGDQMVTVVKDEPSELVVRTSLRKCRLLISFVPD